ncbi:MAG: hypothetical protein ABSE21_20340 [Bryobacteraceae bacterium]|jgi:hypothetical protein
MSTPDRLKSGDECHVTAASSVNDLDLGKQDMKNNLLIGYACGTLGVREDDDVDETARKLQQRQQETDRQIHMLRQERDAITTALAIAGIRPTNSPSFTYSHEENVYWMEQPFCRMTLADSCLRALQDHAALGNGSQWLDKNQIEYLIRRGGFNFKTSDSLNSVKITLGRLAVGGSVERCGGKGSRSSRYRFVKEREDALADSRATKG